MRNWAAPLMVLAVALAGCGDDGGNGGGDGGGKTMDFTCPDGTVVQVPADRDDGAAFLAPCPPPPSVHIGSLNATLQAYARTSASWTVDPGNWTGGHTMLTKLVAGTASVADADLQPDTGYGIELARHEHQNLPRAPFEATFSITESGTYYVRAYAQVRGEGHPDRDFWSPERMLQVTAVQATGETVIVTHPAGNLLGELDPASVTLQLGDALVFANDDATAHTLTQASGPADIPDIEAASMADSESVLFLVPGSYSFETDDVQPQTLTVEVAAP